MKSINQGRLPFTLRTLATLVLLIALSGIVGCHSAGYQKGDDAAKTLQQAEAQVKVERRQIEATIEALNDLVQRPAPDLKPQFDRLNTELDRLVASAERVERTRQRMEQKSADYFDTWDKQLAAINYGKIREQSEARRAAVTNELHSIDARYQDAHTVVWALINYFRDIRTALSVDLTRAGLDSVKDIVSNADQNSDKVKVALNALADELAKSGIGLSSVVAPARSPMTITNDSRVSVRSPVSTE